MVFRNLSTRADGLTHYIDHHRKEAAHHAMKYHQPDASARWSFVTAAHHAMKYHEADACG